MVLKQVGKWLGRMWDETGPKSAGEQIKEMAGTGVNVLTNEGRASLPDDATVLVDGDEKGGPTDMLECSGTRRSERCNELSLIHIPSPRDLSTSRMPSSA